MQVFIMRGIPGSGKSWWVKNERKCYHHSWVVSADDYFVIDGVYRYIQAEINEAHRQCLQRYLAIMDMKSVDAVFVDNTNAYGISISPYWQIAEAKGHAVKIVTMYCDFLTGVRRNIHKVPATRIRTMLHAINEEKLPPWWTEEIIAV